MIYARLDIRTVVETKNIDILAKNICWNVGSVYDFYRGKVANFTTVIFIISSHYQNTYSEQIQTFLMTTEEVYGRPCRACNDFKSFMKNVPTPGGQADGGETVARDNPHHQCPPDRMELGSRSWSLLHSVAAYFPLSQLYNSRKMRGTSCICFPGNQYDNGHWT